MARSPLTLAAAVTAAVPGAEVSGARRLSAGGDARYDSAIATLGDGREIVIRVPVDDDAERELSAQALALGALTAGVRGLLGLDVPEVVGRTTLDGRVAVVTTMLSGYQIEAAEIPPGEGAARSIGRALAVIHALPASVARGTGLRERTAQDVRDDVSHTLERAAASGHVPVRLTVRWREAVDDDRLWSFEPAVVLGGTAAEAFLFADDDRGAPVVTGVYDWHGLALDDPALDLSWLSNAPAAYDDVHDAYSEALRRAPDAALRVRARLHAEMEFARWLLHGTDARRDDVVRDAAALLETLADEVRDYGLFDDMPRTRDVDVNDAIALAGRVPAAAERTHVDTAMETDAYSPEDLAFADGSGWGDHGSGSHDSGDDDERTGSADSDEAADESAAAHRREQEFRATEPLELSEFEREVLADGSKPAAEA